MKNLAEARNSAISTRLQRWRDISSSAVPILALVVTALTVILQTRQFRQTLTQQVEQFGRTERQQAEAHEDTEWREALKDVSFKDPRSSLVGAFAMQGFFNNPRYRDQAREIASGLLANTINVSSFDEILTNMRDKTDGSNLAHMTSLAQMLGFAQRAKHRMKGAASVTTAPFLTKDVDEIDPNPKDFEHNADQQLKVAAWEIDSVSQFLRQLWRDPNKGLSPQHYVLTGTVLENGDFDNLDFSGSHLDFGILYNATFRNVHFKDATLKDLFVRHVNLEGADFSGVSEVTGSRWEDTNWWRAKCVPPAMLEYLVQQTKHAVSQDDRMTLARNCQ
ncbi:MAG: pentapeptide repeat-containing protein [Candidatus Sulfotelmatobacter sp.]